MCVYMRVYICMCHVRGEQNACRVRVAGCVCTSRSDSIQVIFIYMLGKRVRGAGCGVQGAGCGFRTIPSEVLTLDDLGMGEVFKRVSDFKRGVVLVTGPTGSGKSTTLAAMIDYINGWRPLFLMISHHIFLFEAR